MTYSVTIEVNGLDDAGVARLREAAGVRDHQFRVRPLAPEGMTRVQLLGWYEGLPPAHQHEVVETVERMFALRFEKRRADELWGEEFSDWPYLEGGDRTFEADGEEFEDAEEVVEYFRERQEEGEEFDFAFDGDTEEIVEELIDRRLVTQEWRDGYGGHRPAWNTVWMVDFLPDNKTPQGVYDFTGMQVYGLDNHPLHSGYVLGVDGGGYSFYGAHILPLAYLYGWLSR